MILLNPDARKTVIISFEISTFQRNIVLNNSRQNSFRYKTLSARVNGVPNFTINGEFTEILDEAGQYLIVFQTIVLWPDVIE